MAVHQDVIYARQDTYSCKHSFITVRSVSLIVASSVLEKDEIYLLG